jgi:3-hydroxybutyryl-CoA dehydrogenase
MLTKKIVVVGIGTAGKSISLALAQNNYNVTVITRRGENGFQDLRNFIETVESHKTLQSKSEALSRISWARDFCEESHDPELVIEAVRENLREKQQLFKKMDKIYSPDIMLSSATSSLSVTEIAKFMVNPERMIGLHFFNPANVMKLVEIIPGEKTSMETVEKAKMFVQDIGKTPLVTPDIPGFIVNRILFAMINEAICLLGEGQVLARDIDEAMKLGVNHPMGPLSLADFIGLDNCLVILENLHEKTKSPEYKPHPLLIQKVKENDLGRKTGRGFFNYFFASEGLGTHK